MSETLYEVETTLKKWFHEDFRFSLWNENVQVARQEAYAKANSVWVARYDIILYTDSNSYRIGATIEEFDSIRTKTYLGCISSSRKPRAGEDWSRGNDLADGKFDKDTWKQIVADIVSYELVKVHRPKSPDLHYNN